MRNLRLNISIFLAKIYCKEINIFINVKEEKHKNI